MNALPNAVPARLLPYRASLYLGACLLTMLLSGCHHKQAPPTLPAILKAPDAPPPAPESPTMAAAPPTSISTAPAIKVTEVKPKRRARKSSAKLPEPAPMDVSPAPSSTAAIEVSSLGALSAGGESNPQNQQEATALIAATARRLEALSKTKGGKQESQVANQVREVRRFLQQAREALGTGDAEGAKTLATKAKLLMDDLDKWVQQ